MDLQIKWSISKPQDGQPGERIGRVRVTQPDGDTLLLECKPGTFDFVKRWVRDVVGMFRDETSNA